MIRAVGAAALAAAALGAAAWARPADLVISVVSTATSVKTHDVAPKGTSPGDYVVMEDRLTNAVRQFGKPRGAGVGSDRAVERVGAGRVVTLEGVTTLPGGTVRINGRIQVDAQRRAAVPVVGGTGRYDGARGTLTIVNLSQNGNVALNVYRLVLLPVS